MTRLKQFLHAIYVLSAFLILSATHYLAATIDVSTATIDESTTLIILQFDTQPDDFIYKEYVDISVDAPGVELSAWNCSTEPENYYDQKFNENKKILRGPFALTLQAKRVGDAPKKANIHVSYLKHGKGNLSHELVPVILEEPVSPSLATAVEAQDATILETPTKPAHTPHPTPKIITQSWSGYFESLVKKTESLPLRIIFAFLLGILVSLTPCIYPMIPITIGILQTTVKKSLLANFIAALTYTAGIATTFAIFGSIAAFTGQLFGTIMRNPIFILAVVGLLLYMALSMLGLYELYLPKIMRSPGYRHTGNGSLLSTFLFGLLSGTVASPCLSPGLLLLLGIVSLHGSVIGGFTLLFAFGIGLGLPLIVIGTFSSVLTALPRAGSWMVEVKKFFGFMLLGMCFYFLRPLVPAYLLYAGMAVTTMIIGIWYLYTASLPARRMLRLLKNMVGITLLVLTCMLAAKAYKELLARNQLESQLDSFWMTDLEKAFAHAKKENKKLFICFGSPSCSLCSAIDKSLLSKPVVTCALAGCVPIKLNGADSSNESCCQLQKKYTIAGFPTYLLVDPHTQNLIKRWGGELYGTTPEAFVAELECQIKG